MAVETGKDGKVCTRCKEWKMFGDFPKDKYKQGGYHSHCNECRKVQKEKWDASMRVHQQRHAQRILCFGDDQAPAQHPDALDILKEAKHRFSPTRVIHMGDEADMNFMMEYLRSADCDDANSELDKAREHLNNLYALFPKVDVLRSNHVDSRVGKAASRAGIPSQLIKSIHEMLHMPDTWVRHDELIIDDIIFRHGHKDSQNLKSTINRKMLHRHRQYYNILCGHHHQKFGYSHLPDMVAENGRIKFAWGAHCGCMMDRNHPYAQAYSPGYEIVGFTVIEDGAPKFILPELDHHNRWTGVLYNAYGSHEL